MKKKLPVTMMMLSVSNKLTMLVFGMEQLIINSNELFTIILHFVTLNSITGTRTHIQCVLEH